MTNMDTLAGGSLDPFFSLTDDSEWNACIGKQGSEHNYLDGYIEVAIELASAVIDKRQYEKRDTLALPILYNARHAVELSLKFAIERLYGAGIIARPHAKNHDIKSHWELIDSTPLGDASLRKLIADLEPFIESLHGIDEDGQQLRYAKTQDGQMSLEDKALCNLQLIRSSLLVLNDILLALKYRSIELVDERSTGTFTRECSRRDLLTIAKMLPPRNQWSEPAFNAAKHSVMARFRLSGRKFSEAVDVIKRHREMGGLVGYESELAHLTDHHARCVIHEWSKAHPPRPMTDDLGMDYFDRDLDEMREEMRALAAAEKAVLNALSHNEIADLEAIFYIGRERLFCEVYDERVEASLNEHKRASDPAGEVHHLLTKTNLLCALARGVEILGRPSLAADLRALRPDLTGA